MENSQWLWKSTSSEKSPGETGSLGSISSHSEIYPDDQQEVLNLSPNHSTQSPEVTSKTVVTEQEVNDGVKSLTEKLSAALVNISTKEDLVKQHARVTEEAVAGWEKAENEIVVLKRQLDSAVLKNSALENRVSHLDGALKECVRQLRQAREEHEEKIHEAIQEKTSEWESTKLELESQLLKLKTQAVSTKIDSLAAIDPDLHLKLKFLEKENAALKLEIYSQSKELEILTIERDLSTKAAEAASKQHLESIKKMAKLEAECRRMQVVAHKPSTVNNHKSVAASPIYVESLTDSQSESGEWLDAVEIDTQITSRSEQNDCKPSCTASWASALIAELDQFKKEKTMSKNPTACSIKIDIMNDFLEMEQLAALPENESQSSPVKSEAVANKSADVINSLKSELDTMIHQIEELEEKLEKIEAEKAELESNLTATQDFLKASEVHLMEAEMRSERLQKGLSMVNELKELLEFQLIDMQVEAQTLYAEVDSLKAEADKERHLSAEIAVKCRELEDKLMRKTQEVEFHQTAYSDGKLKIKDEAIAIAAGKLAECQKTVASLGRQLKTLATLEDFLIDSGNLPRFTGGEELWKLHYNDTFMPKSDPIPSKVPGECSGPSEVQSYM